MVKLDELRVSLDAVERVALDSGLVQQARAMVIEESRAVLGVIAVPTVKGWELAKVGGKRALVDALSTALRRSSEIEVLPRRWRFADPWPVNADGKSPESLLKERFDRRRPEFRVLEASATKARVEILVAASSPFFEGHFPDLPILPGVAQIDWMIWLSGVLFGEQAGVRRARGRQVPEGDPPRRSHRGVARVRCHGTPYALRDPHRRRVVRERSHLLGRRCVKVCAVIPVFEHVDTVARVIDALRANGLPCLVVDDGNADAAAAALLEIARARSGVDVLRREINGGKGAAIQDGLAEAARRGFTHALQIDADGQHDTADIPRFLDLARAHPDRLVYGVPKYDDSVPRSRLYGRYATHVWVWINTLSLEIRDTMCGFRLYPLRETMALLARGALPPRMDFDTEVMVRLHWRGVRFVPVITRVTYPPGGRSHFRLLRDNLRISWMHTRLFGGLLLRLPLLIVAQGRRTPRERRGRRSSLGLHRRRHVARRHPVPAVDPSLVRPLAISRGRVPGRAGELAAATVPAPRVPRLSATHRCVPR